MLEIIFFICDLKRNIVVGLSPFTFTVFLNFYREGGDLDYFTEFILFLKDYLRKTFLPLKELRIQKDVIIC